VKAVRGTLMAFTAMRVPLTYFEAGQQPIRRPAR
jgi:hypothetical protein